MALPDAKDRLKQAREARGFATAADAARAMGVSTPTYQAHENGTRNFPSQAAKRYAKFLKVEPGWLLYGEGSTPSEGDAVNDFHAGEALVPVYDIAASAGHGSLVEQEQIVDTLAFPRHYLERIANRSAPRDLAIISVKGDSMLPTLASGDVVLVDLSKRDASYDGLFVLRNGGDALLIKRLAPGSRRGTVNLISDNARLYPPVEREASEIEIVGKVLWMGVKV